MTEFARIAGGDQALRLLGVDPLAEAPFRSYLADEAEQIDYAAAHRLIAEPGAVVVSEALAGRLGLELEDELQVSVGGRFSPAWLVGILQPADSASRQALDDLIISDIASAQEIAGMSGRLSRIDLILDEDKAEMLRAALPVGIQLLAVKEENALDQMVATLSNSTCKR